MDFFLKNLPGSSYYQGTPNLFTMMVFRVIYSSVLFENLTHLEIKNYLKCFQDGHYMNAAVFQRPNIL